MRPFTWWLRRIVALVVASQAATLPGIYAFILAELVTDPVPAAWAMVPGLAVYGFVFAVVFTLIVDGPRQLIGLVHHPVRPPLEPAPGRR